MKEKKKRVNGGERKGRGGGEGRRNWERLEGGRLLR